MGYKLQMSAPRKAKISDIKRCLNTVYTRAKVNIETIETNTPIKIEATG
jgi:hypothetical protein